MPLKYFTFFYRVTYDEQGILTLKDRVMMIRKFALATGLAMLLAACQAPVPSVVSAPVSKPVPVCAGGDIMMQTTLWFGLNRPHGAAITAQEWQSFVDKDVTPRFKEGLSVYDAKGQWLGQDGTVAHENSKALMLIHGSDRTSQASIEALREIYKKRFAQESVMRVDAPVCVSF